MLVWRDALIPIKLATPFNELPRSALRRLRPTCWTSGISRFLQQAFLYDSHHVTQSAVRDIWRGLLCVVKALVIRIAECLQDHRPVLNLHGSFASQSVLDTVERHDEAKLLLAHCVRDSVYDVRPGWILSTSASRF